ncbi:MAG: hypothetical protein FWG67_04645 [Defluviitaleaceae bacterium]|nr:hypothetical protein [Defluviitaleaceae bacterium]
MKVKRRLLTIFVAFSLFTIAFFGWIIYRDTTWAVIDVSQLQNITLEKNEENDLILTGNVELEPFTSVATVELQNIDGILYIFIMKTSAIIPNTEIYYNISSTMRELDFLDFQKIYLVSGENIMVVFPNEPTRNYLDATRYSDKSELFLPN